MLKYGFDHLMFLSYYSIFKSTLKSGMDLIIDGWFHERGELWPG